MTSPEFVQWMDDNKLSAKTASDVLLCSVASINSKRIGAKPITKHNKRDIELYNQGILNDQGVVFSEQPKHVRGCLIPR